MPRSLAEIMQQADILSQEFEDFEPSPRVDARGSEALAELHRAALRRAEAEAHMAAAVERARKAGVPWDAIGRRLGTSGEAARQRYRLSQPSPEATSLPPRETRTSRQAESASRSDKAESGRPTVALLTDDIDGGDADRTVEFGIDGVTYSIDLSQKNSGELRKVLNRYLESASRVSRAGRAQEASPRAASPRRTSKDQDQAIREWAVKNGYEVSERGRIPRSVVEAFRAKR